MCTCVCECVCVWVCAYKCGECAWFQKKKEFSSDPSNIELITWAKKSFKDRVDQHSPLHRHSRFNFKKIKIKICYQLYIIAPPPFYIFCCFLLFSHESVLNFFIWIFINFTWIVLFRIEFKLVFQTFCVGEAVAVYCD